MRFTWVVFGLSFDALSYLMCVSSECSCDIALMQRLVWAFADRLPQMNISADSRSGSALFDTFPEITYVLKIQRREDMKFCRL